MNCKLRFFKDLQMKSLCWSAVKSKSYFELLWSLQELSFQNEGTLENAGIQCRRIISYETSENQDLKSIMAVLQQQSICAFFSPSGVKSAMPHFSSEHLKSAKFVAIGETTKQALENYDIGIFQFVCKGFEN